MSEKPLSAHKWAFKLTHILNAVYGSSRFPIDVESVIKDFSKEIYPDDSITLVKGAKLPGFEGALYRAPTPNKGWGIIYNSDITSPGRINFTLAHEFGHYLIHRLAYPNGLECTTSDIVMGGRRYNEIEDEANMFAADFLMPLDDFRAQLPDTQRPTLRDLSRVADRYKVSLTAAILRWLGYTHKRACLVLSRDGYILWSRSSNRAFKSGIYHKTTDRPPIPVPPTSLAYVQERILNQAESIQHDSGIWFNDECEESSLFSDRYDFAITLLLFAS